MIDRDTTESARSGRSEPRAQAFPGRVEAAGSRPLASGPDGADPSGAGSRDTFESRPIGEYLRRQRVLREITIEELCTLTRIPLRSLERLERGEFDGETDGFVRGFVRTVALALGLDAEDTISRMLQEPVVGGWEKHQPGRRSKQWLAGVSLVVIAILAVLLVQAGWRVLVGSGSDDPGREVIVWRDPVRSLAEATGAEVDPSGEIDPSRGTRVARRARALDAAAGAVAAGGADSRASAAARTPAVADRPR